MIRILTLSNVLWSHRETCKVLKSQIWLNQLTSALQPLELKWYHKLFLAPVQTVIALTKVYSPNPPPPYSNLEGACFTPYIYTIYTIDIQNVKLRVYCFSLYFFMSIIKLSTTSVRPLCICSVCTHIENRGRVDHLWTFAPFPANRIGSGGFWPLKPAGALRYQINLSLYLRDR